MISFRSKSKSNSKLNIGGDENNNGLRLQMRLPIDDIFHVEDAHDQISMKKYNGRAFEIHSSVKSIIVFAKNIKEKTEWLLAMTECLEKVQNGILYNGKTRYELSSAVWVPDNWSDSCMVDNCRKKFNSLTNRRHHCRWCGKLICSTCGKYKLAHKLDANSMIKPVCKQCYNLYHARFRATSDAKLYRESDQDDDDETSVMTKIDKNNEQ